MYNPSTQVLIFSPLALHRAAWLALMTGQPGIEAIGSLACLEEVAPFQPVTGPMTLLVDVQIVQPDLVQKLHTAFPGCGLLFLVQEDRLEEIVALIKAGATGLISRNQTEGDLSRAIIAAGRGELVLPSKLAVQSLLFLAGNESSQSPLEPLTLREKDVLALLAQGQTNKDIAQSLFLSVRTVEAHIHTIFRKIEVRSRTEAALWGVRQGYGQGS